MSKGMLLRLVVGMCLFLGGFFFVINMFFTEIKLSKVLGLKFKVGKFDPNNTQG